MAHRRTSGKGGWLSLLLGLLLPARTAGAASVAIAILILAVSPAIEGHGQPVDLDERLRQVDEALGSDASDGVRLLQELNGLRDSMDAQQRYRLEIMIAKSDLVAGNTRAAVKRLIDLDRVDLTVDSLLLLNKLLALAYKMTGDYEEMFIRIDRGLNLLDEVSDTFLKTGFLHPVILAYREAGAIDDALRKSNEMLEMSRTYNHPYHECFALKEAGETYLLAEDPGRAEAVLNEAHEFCSANGNKVLSSAILVSLAQLHVERGAPGKALPLIEEALTQSESAGFALLRATALAIRSEALLALGRFAEASETAQAGLAANETAQYVPAQADLFRALARAEEALGRTAEALAAYKQHIAINDKVQNDRLARRLAYHRTRYDALEKERQIQLLSQQKELLTLSRELERKTRQNLQLLISIGGGLVIGLILWLVHSTGQKRMFRRQAESDGLTGLANRSHFISKSRSALASGLEAPFSFVVFDLDHFKALNDSFGHAAGDWVLREVAAKCRERIRKSDIFGRIGGEEFAICMPGAGLEEAIRVAEACREALRGIDASALSPDLTITASFGISSRQPGEKDIGPILIRADGALYDAKRAGRDTVRVAGAPATAFSGPDDAAS